MKTKTYIEIPFMTGSDGEATISFLNTAFLVKNDLEKQYPDPVFGEWLITEIYEKQKILAVKKGLIKKKFLCPRCKTELNLSLRSQLKPILNSNLKISTTSS